jgi:hypothetical protein
MMLTPMRYISWIPPLLALNVSESHEEAVQIRNEQYPTGFVMRSSQGYSIYENIYERNQD